MDGDNFTEAAVTLVQSRSYHLCWNVGDNIFLLGGRDSRASRTTEMVRSDGSSSKASFNLKYEVRLGQAQFFVFQFPPLRIILIIALFLDIVVVLTLASFSL